MATMNHKKTPAMIFDVGGVLVEWNPKHLFSKMFAGEEEKMDRFLSEVCSADWNSRQDLGLPFSQAIAEREQDYPEYAPYIRAYFERWDETVKGEVSGTVEIVKALRDAGYTLHILSNWSAETYEMILKRFEFLGWFDEVIVSGRVGLIKPGREIFDLMLRRIGLEANQCLFIDDSSINISAANALGFQTVHFRSAQQLLAELGERQLLGQ